MNINTKLALVEFRLVGTNKSRIHYFTKKDTEDFLNQTLKDLAAKGHKIISGLAANRSELLKGDTEVSFRNPEDFSLLLRVIIKK